MGKKRSNLRSSSKGCNSGNNNISIGNGSSNSTASSSSSVHNHGIINSGHLSNHTADSADAASLPLAIPVTNAASSSRQQQQQLMNPPTTTSSHVLSIREFFLVTLTSTPFVKKSVNHINALLRYAKVPEKSLLTNEEFVLSSTAVIVTLVGYYVLFGKRHRNKRKRLAEELRLAQRQVRHQTLFSFFLAQSTCTLQHA